MPNVAPRGLFARNAATWKPPLNVYARVAGVWKPANFVWARQAGTWQLIWGRAPVEPATVAASWMAPAMVRITWTAPAINTNTHWIVRRSDGSIVVIVPVETVIVDDTRPLLANGVTTNSTVGAYTVEGSDGSTSSARKSTNTVTFNFTPATQSTSASYPNATTSAVTLNWTPNATYGRPQGWMAYLDGTGFMGAVVPGTDTTITFTGRPRGVVEQWRIVPMSQNPDGAWVQAGNSTPIPTSFKAVDPLSVALAAVGISNLRLTWANPSGSRTGYEIQRYVSSWAAHTTTTNTVTDWPTTVAGYMRVRTLSAGGPSDWVQAGPVTPVNDTTGPVASIITSFVPEASYGRMVVRGTWPSSPDVVTGQIFAWTGTWVSVWGPSAVSPGSGLTLNTLTGSAGFQSVLVRTWDATGNQGTDAQANYTLVASPVVVDPSGDLSGTYRGSGWRNDSTRSLTEIATGWTSGGTNIGCWFYGNTIAPAIAGRTITSASIEYWRENEGGLSSGVQPLFWTHTLPGRTAAPVFSGEAVDEASRLGSAVARTGTTGGYLALPTAFIAALKAGSALGLGVFRPYQGSGDPDNYYELLSIGGVVGGSPQYVNGRLKFHHLG